MRNRGTLENSTKSFKSTSKNTMGPKKGGANRGGPKKPPPAEVSIDDFVAAGSKGADSKSKSGPKGKSKKQNAAGDSAAEASSEQPKKPTVRSIIGGSSWTGKLPVNMLSEHCQKQKWEKPEYTMVLCCFYVLEMLIYAHAAFIYMLIE